MDEQTALRERRRVNDTVGGGNVTKRRTLELLVLGAGRGGTSLLAALLDSHPRVSVGFERHVKSTLLADSHQGHPDARAAAFLAACATEAVSSDTRIHGNKITTEQLARLEDMAGFPQTPTPATLRMFFDEMLADCRFIFILRDGRSCVRSKMARAGLDLEGACRRWRYAAGVYHFLARHPRALCLRYETLLTAPETELRRACASLEVPYAPQMLDGTLHPRMNPDYRNAGFDAAKAGLDDVPEGCEAMLAAELERCGYALRASARD